MTFSEDPLKETLAEIGIFVGVIGLVVYFINRMKNGQEKVHGMEKKGGLGKRGGMGKKGGMDHGKKEHGKRWMIFMAIVVLIFLSCCIQLYMQNIRNVKNPQIQQEYSGMFDYSQQKWTTGFYSGLFYTTYALSIPVMILGLRGGAQPWRP